MKKKQVMDEGGNLHLDIEKYFFSEQKAESKVCQSGPSTGKLISSGNNSP